MPIIIIGVLLFVGCVYLLTHGGKRFPANK